MSVIVDEARKGLARSYRLSGPLLAQAGLLPLLARWGGRPTDTLTHAATFIGLPTTWVENTRDWFDDPIRQRGLTLAVAAITSLLLLSLGIWAGRWLGESEARSSLLRQAGKDHAARSQVLEDSGEYLAARAAGTGSSIWLGVALLLELRSLTPLNVLLTIPVVIATAIASYAWGLQQPFDAPRFSAAVGMTLGELGIISFFALGLSLVSPERRVANMLMFRPPKD